MMKKFDAHPMVLAWSSESISIPYQHPFEKTRQGAPKWSMYIPDFFVVYQNAKGQKNVEILEVKPAKEMPGYKGRSTARDKLVQAVNAAKWQAAIIYCAKRNWHFRVATEVELFGYTRKNQ